LGALYHTFPMMSLLKFPLDMGFIFKLFIFGGGCCCYVGWNKNQYLLTSRFSV